MTDDIIKYYKLCGIRLKYDEADKLYSYTEGWVRALYLLMLNYKESGKLISFINIYTLFENAVYQPFHKDIKDFLLSMCVSDYFNREQTIHMLEYENQDLF